MPAIVYQTNKKTGVTYAYESISYWDKDKRQSRAKRRCIGRLDPKTQEVIPTRKKKEGIAGEKIKRGPVPITRTARSFYGAPYLFDRIGEDTGVTEDLKKGLHNSVFSFALILGAIFSIFCLETNVSDHLFGFKTAL